jgi:hypothetical protein
MSHFEEEGVMGLSSYRQKQFMQAVSLGKSFKKPGTGVKKKIILHL